MTIEQLKSILSNYPDDMTVVLLDLNSDDEDGSGVYRLMYERIQPNMVDDEDGNEIEVLTINFFGPIQ